MIQDLKTHFDYYFAEKNIVLKNRFYSRVIYVELNKIITGVFISYNIFESGAGCMLYENLRQDIHLKIYEIITQESIKSIKNVNGYIFIFAKNHCLNEQKRQNKLNKIKELINEHQ